MNQDTLHRILFKNAPVKGELVQLPNTWQTLLSTNQKRNYPTAVEHLIGQMVAASVLLSANLKFDGSLIMQIHGDGPIQLLVAECRSDLTVRATAKLREHAVVKDEMSLQQLINVNGQAHFAITLDPNDKMPGQQPYQGIVPLDGDTMAEVLMHYMHSPRRTTVALDCCCKNYHCMVAATQMTTLTSGMNSITSHKRCPMMNS